MARDRPCRHRQQDVAAEDVFVPDYRSVASEEITGGPNPGSEVNPAVLYRLRAVSLFAFCIAGVSLGIAQGAIGYFEETMRTRTSYYTGRNLADFVTLQVHLGEASAITDAARAVILSDCDEATRIVGDGQMPSLVQRARYRRDGAYAATLCTRAVDLLFTAIGGGGIYARTLCSAPSATCMRRMRITSSTGTSTARCTDASRSASRPTRRFRREFEDLPCHKTYPAAITRRCTAPPPRASMRANCATRSAPSPPASR